MIRSTAPFIRHHLSWQPLARALRGVLDRWRNRAEQRQLAALSDAMLQDIGLIRADVEREYLKPFWERVDHATLEAVRRIGSARARRYY